MIRFLKKARRFILHYWLAISIGLIATPYAAQYAYNERGHLAFGGEYLVLPVIVMGAYLLEQIIPAILEIFFDEEESEDDRSRKRINRTGNVRDYRSVPEADRNRRRSG